MIFSRFKGIILILSIALNFVFAMFWYKQYHVNVVMKQNIILQYANQQTESLGELERALNNQDHKEEFVKALMSAYGIIYHNFLLTSNYPFDDAKGKVDFPQAIMTLNSPYQSKAIGYALIQASTNGKVDDKWIQELRNYTAQVLQVVKTLDYEQKLKGKSLKSQYRVLREVDELISGFHLKPTNGTEVQ